MEGGVLVAVELVGVGNWFHFLVFYKNCFCPFPKKVMGTINDLNINYGQYFYHFYFRVFCWNVYSVQGLQKEKVNRFLQAF